MHITVKLYSAYHKTKHTPYTVFPEMPMVAQLIKVFPKCITITVHYTVHQNVIQCSPRAQSKSIPIQYIKIHFNIILPHSHGPLNGIFHSHFPFKTCSRLPSLLCMLHSLPIFRLSFDTLLSDKHHKL
jgi:hypothetical protein